VKKSKMQSWGGISDTNSFPITDKPTKCSDKLSVVFAARDLILLDPSKTKMVSYSAMGRPSFVDGESISKIF